MHSRPQDIIASTQHWGDIASSAVGQVAPAVPASHRVVYLPPPGDGDFSRGFNAQVMTEFVKRGIAVSNDPSEPYTVKITANVVDHTHIPTPPVASALVAAGVGSIFPIAAPRASEVIITVALTTRSKVFAASTGSFYVDFSDGDEYRNYPATDSDAAPAQMAGAPVWRPLTTQ